jgi:hypothetical protein
MRMTHGVTIAVASVVLAGCGDAGLTNPHGDMASTRGAYSMAVSGSVTGGGHYALPGLDVQFAFSAIQHGDGRATGQFHHQADEGEGLTIDVQGEVTCLAIDPVNQRAWIGGVITRNTSTDPDLQTSIHQPGQDVWFRVLDAGEGGDSTDRSTFIGFSGSAGFLTSAAYCAGRPWAAGNARTWPVTGNVSIRP